MLRSETKFKPMALVAGRFNGRVFGKGPVGMDRIVILYKLDFRGFGVVGLQVPVHKAAIIGLGFGCLDLQMALANVDVIVQ